MTKGILIENDEQKQIIFGEPEYKNYDEIKKLLESKIERVEKIPLRYFPSKAFVATFILLVLSLIIFAISNNI